MSYHLRKARTDDQPELERLIACSARELSAGDYSMEQIEAALQGTFGVDSQLVKDGTYYVVEHQGALVGCGGWSRRRTLFGGDAHAGRDPGELDPACDAARIRAFFVDPAHARRGLGKTILQRCEADAQAAGFSRFELMATLPGVPLYAAFGYTPATPVQHPLRPGLLIEFVPMHKHVRA
jgi:N-acetylglutamate synthase-like GNAT family acetyltransferase